MYDVSASWGVENVSLSHFMENVDGMFSRRGLSAVVATTLPAPLVSGTRVRQITRRSNIATARL